MSGKKVKGGTAGWMTCSKCQRRLPRNLSGKHVDNNCNLVYPFLQHGTLHATLVNATTSSKIQNLPFVKCSRLSSSTIFIPEELIRESGFRSFSWVTLSLISTSKDDNAQENKLPLALRIWPVPDIISPSSGSVMMTKDGFLANHLTSGDHLVIKLQPLSSFATLSTTCLTPPAESIVLEIDDLNCDIDKVNFEIDRFIHSFRNWFRGRLLTKGNGLRVRYYAEVIPFKVKSVKCADEQNLEDALEALSLTKPEYKGCKSELRFGEINESTQIDVVFKSGCDTDFAGDQIQIRNLISLSDVGGLDSVIKELIATVNFMFTSNLKVARGILLYGHSGTGKSHLIQALCSHFKMSSITFNEFDQQKKRGPINRNNSSKSASTSNSLSKVFQEAISRTPAAIIVDNLDILAPSKISSSYSEQNSSNFAATLQPLLSSLSGNQNKIVVFATATDVDAVDSRLRSPQMCAKEVELPVPSRIEREDILQKILSKVNHSLNSGTVKEIASSTHGFVGADLYGLCIQAIQCAAEKVTHQKLSMDGDDSDLKDVQVTVNDIIPCLKSVKPSAAKSILVDVPNVRWNDIGGQSELKFKLKQAIEWPLKHPEAFQRLGITPPKGILMYGPPGCSKTMIAKAIATESGLNFISVKGSELFSKWVGESEKAVRDVFRKARQVSPCVVFFDEIDSLGGERGSTSGSSNVHERVLAQLLVELDGIEPLKDVTIVAATNRPDIIDQALLRPGRLDRIVYVPLPDEETRREILKIRFRNMPIDPSVDIEKIVQTTDGYSGAELAALSHEAALKALEEDIVSTQVFERHFIQALEIVKPRIGKDQIQFYETYSSLQKAL